MIIIKEQREAIWSKTGSRLQLRAQMQKGLNRIFYKYFTSNSETFFQKIYELSVCKGKLLKCIESIF